MGDARPEVVRSEVERFAYAGASLVAELFGASFATDMVFLHGWGTNRESLRGLAVLFQHKYRVHLIDLPGFGHAPPPPPDWDTIRYATLIQNYLIARGGESVIVVGHSFGGRIAVRVGAMGLPQVHGLVLMGVPGLPSPQMSRRHLRRMAIRGLRQLLLTVQPVTGPHAVAWHTRRFASTDYLSAGQMRPVFVRVVNEDLTVEAMRIACPTLLLWGGVDGETPPWLAHRYVALIGSRATLKILDHKDHYPFTGTGAHLCALKIREWMQVNVDA